MKTIVLTFFMMLVTSTFSLSTVHNFNFGNNSSVDGWTSVSAKDMYNKEVGYGFAHPEMVENVPASGQHELSNAVQFMSDIKNMGSSNTFNVDLDTGLYKITVSAGDMFRESISAEGFFQLMNLTGNNCTDSFIIPVTDGQLNILAMEGKAGTVFTLSSLKIEKISDDPTLPPTIWICGDSTVTKYYPETNNQHGWGQVLNRYVNEKWNVRNLATGGQYAKGFYTSGQHESVMNYIKKGDYYLIAIGINDKKYSNESEYYETITKMVKETIAKKAKPVLIIQQGRASDVGKDLNGRWFSSSLEAVADEQKVDLVNVFKIALSHYNEIGQEATYGLYLPDKLHVNQNGANYIAKIIADNYQEIK